jgi:hypothetical protein
MRFQRNVTLLSGRIKARRCVGRLRHMGLAAAGGATLGGGSRRRGGPAGASRQRMERSRRRRHDFKQWAARAGRGGLVRPGAWSITVVNLLYGKNALIFIVCVYF